MISVARKATAPRARGRRGQRLQAQDALEYLSALGTWREERKRELDHIDEAALAASDGSTHTGDLLLSMSLWKAVADRHDLLVATWDSGRVGPTELERLSTLIWGRLDTTTSGGPVSAGGALAVSLPEARRLSDALAASLRARLRPDASPARPLNPIRRRPRAL